MGAYAATLSHCMWTVAPCLGSEHSHLLSHHGIVVPDACLNSFVCSPIHTVFGLINLWDEAALNWHSEGLWQNMSWELVFELEDFVADLYMGRQFSEGLYHENLNLNYFNNAFKFYLYYMTLYVPVLLGIVLVFNLHWTGMIQMRSTREDGWLSVHTLHRLIRSKPQFSEGWTLISRGH